MFEITQEIIGKHVDTIIDVIEGIKEHKLTVLVGPNGVGKSLIRKQMTLRFYKEYGKAKSVNAISMELRTGSKPELGALCGMGRDNAWLPTSICTYDLIKKMLKPLRENNAKKIFFIFDEPDIGMSRESECGIADYIISYKEKLENEAMGGLVITHSDEIVNRLVAAGAEFIYIGYNETGSDYNAWKNRKIEPTDFEWLDNWSSKLFDCILNDRSEPVEQKK